MRLGARREIAATSEILALARPIFGALARKQRPYRIGEPAAVRLAAAGNRSDSIGHRAASRCPKPQATPQLRVTHRDHPHP
jgi:hypothetical protein